jgi:hypothetical protein
MAEPVPALMPPAAAVVALALVTAFASVAVVAITAKLAVPATWAVPVALPACAAVVRVAAPAAAAPVNPVAALKSVLAAAVRLIAEPSVAAALWKAQPWPRFQAGGRGENYLAAIAREGKWSIPFSHSRVILEGLRFRAAAMAEGLSLWTTA